MNLLDLQNDPAEFRSALLIDTDGGPKPFAEIIDAWQDTDFRALDSGWQRAVIGAKHQATHQRAWLERPRGHSKSLDLAIMAAWALFASRRRLSLIGCAADLDQARLLRDAMGRLVYCNPWLGKLLEVQNYRCINTRTESSLDIISSDAKSSYGLTPDGIIADEVVHWKNRDLWDSILSSAAKRSTCMLVIITNAGIRGDTDDDWQWVTRETIRTDPKWYFSRLDGPVASWISADILAEQKRLLPSIAFDRLWMNQWSSAGGDALTEEVINAAFKPDLAPQTSGKGGYTYLCGLDLGVSRDASAVCVLGVRRTHDGHGRIRLAHTQVWRPSKGHKVDLQAVEDAILELHARFNFKQINFDPWQAVHMASRLQSAGLGKFAGLTQYGKQRRERLPMVEVPPTGKNLQSIATAVIEAFNDYRLELYENADLRRDVTRFRVEERPYGFRLTSPKDELGHGDLGSAFSLALLAASELAAKKVVIVGSGGRSAHREQTPLQKHYRRVAREYERMTAESSGGNEFQEGLSHALRGMGFRVGRNNNIIRR